MTERPRFHLAFPVDDLEAAREFYTRVLGCGVGRESERWVDFDLHGHQIVAHLAPREAATPTNTVDGDQVPARHFGLILKWADWEALMERLRVAGARFLIEPRVRFRGQAGEQATAFILDPSGNGLEFKAFRDEDEIFRRA